MTSLPARQPDALAERLTRLLETATKGPWFIRADTEGNIIQYAIGRSHCDIVRALLKEDAAFIVEAVNALPQLLSDRKEYAALSDSAEQLGVPTDVQTAMLVKELNKGQLARVIVAGRGQRRADRERIEEYRKALSDIAGGHFADASTLAIAGDWHAMFGRLQAIASGALQGTKP